MMLSLLMPALISIPASERESVVVQKACSSPTSLSHRMTKKRKTVAHLASTPSKKQETKREDALSLSRLASFMSLQSALLYICLTRIPQTFVPVPNPLVEEPVQTLVVLSIAFFCTQLLTTARFRSWYVQDLEREAKKEGKKVTEDGSSFQVEPFASL
jgi:hypothetical protein